MQTSPAAVLIFFCLSHVLCCSTEADEELEKIETTRSTISQLQAAWNVRYTLPRQLEFDHDVKLTNAEAHASAVSEIFALSCSNATSDSSYTSEAFYVIINLRKTSTANQPSQEQTASSATASTVNAQHQILSK